ncbi:MAG: carboxypeptidase-like regulatory domain-containing protein [Acidobacteriota bacterium]|nr:carboxypeptidase-like regulatory domain-containing protein [Acidobacteriota bacterium]
MLVVPSHLFAQTTGTLSGVVKDTTGAIVPGAKITLVAKDDKSVRSTVSSGAAFFSFAAVQTGTYNLTVTAKGFESYVITDIEMHPGDSRNVESIALKIGRVEASVTVTANVAGVDLSSPEKSYLITDEDIKRLSTVGRDATELIRILPGFAVASAGLNNDSTNNGSQVAGFSGSTTGSYAANGSGPGTGAVAVVSDGANTTDPADAKSSIGNVNMEMVAEVKVQTSNFGADSAKGPVVLNAISKSGGSNYHGSVYGYARNSVLNSNDWIDNYFNNARAGTYNYFPGANIGGPVKIPHTNFNHDKKMTFFAAGEVYDQRNLFGNTATLSFIPSARMLSGDLSTDSIERALNLPSGASVALCPTPYGCNGLNNFGAGYSPASTVVDVQGHSIVNGQIPFADFSPNVSAYTRFYPKPNRVPQPQGGPPDCTNAANIVNAVTNVSLLGPGQLCSDNINYDVNIFAQHNGYQYHARVDQNFTDATKLYVTYDYEHVSDQAPVTNTYYAGSAQNIIPSPTGALTYAYSHRLSVNNTHTFGPTLTNELVLAGVYFHSPAQLQNNSLLQDANTGFVGPRYYQNGYTQLPEIINFQGGVPDFAMGYFDPVRGAPKRKYSVNLSDNLTKQIQRHSLKVGVYLEQSANNEYVENYNDPQAKLSYSQYNGCNVYSFSNAKSGLTSGLGNSVGNFLNGCGGYTQVNKFQSGDMKYTTIDTYATDEWQASKKLTLTFGVRFDHLGPWVDVHGQGLAVWEPEKILQNVVYKLDPNDPTTWPGIAWHNGKGTTLDASLPLSGVPSTFLFYSPRAGLAYDMYGNGKTTFRGGWGAYRFHDSYYTSDGPLLTALGVSTYNIPGNYGCTLDQVANSGRINAGQPTVPLGPGPFANQTGQTCGGFSGTPFKIQAADKHDSEQPVTYNYNATVDQRLGHGSMLEVSYSGNQTQHSLTGGDPGNSDADLSNQNAIQLGGLYKANPNTSSPNFGVIAPINYLDVGFYNVQDWRPYPNYTGVLVQNHIGYSNYNALQLSLTKQSGALTYNLNYTWSKAMGIRGGVNGGAVGDSLNMRNNYGLLPFNRKQALNFTFSYQEGTKYHGNRIVGGFLNQWEISGITQLQSGPDVAAFNANFGLYGGYQYQEPGATNQLSVKFDGITQLGTPSVTVQPVVTCDPKLRLPGITNGAKTYINGNCFTLPAPGTNGSFNLPDIHGPMYFNSDLTLIKNVHIRESQSLQLRLAAFNFLNHPNWQLYGGPAAGLNLNFGQNLQRGSNGQINYPTSDVAARAGLVQTSTNFGSTPYKSSLRIIELGFKYSF